MLVLNIVVVKSCNTDSATMHSFVNSFKTQTSLFDNRKLIPYKLFFKGLVNYVFLEIHVSFVCTYCKLSFILKWQVKFQLA